MMKQRGGKVWFIGPEFVDTGAVIALCFLAISSNACSQEMRIKPDKSPRFLVCFKLVYGQV